MTDVPILRQGRILIAAIQASLSDRDMLKLQDRILTDQRDIGAIGVIIDVSGLDVLDSFAARTLCEIASAVKLGGAPTVVVGIQPEVALSMVLLGLNLKDIPSALDLEAGLALIARQAASRDA